MASKFFQELNKRYSKDILSGKKYQEMMSEIIAHNSEKTAKWVGRITEDNYKKSVKRLKATDQKIVKLPELTGLFPTRSVFLAKGAEQGASISQNLRTKLEKNLRDILKEYDGSGKKRMEIQRGTATGKINPELIKDFQKAITSTFEGYTKRDPSTGVPPNIETIAVTEIRRTVGDMKEAYVNELLKRNPKSKVHKTWIQNKKLSKKPRQAHGEVSGKTIPLEYYFQVKRPNGLGYDSMFRPHDPKAPANQVIHCDCDIIYKVRF